MEITYDKNFSQSKSQICRGHLRVYFSVPYTPPHVVMCEKLGNVLLKLAETLAQTQSGSFDVLEAGSHGEIVIIPLASLCPGRIYRGWCPGFQARSPGGRTQIVPKETPLMAVRTGEESWYCQILY
jgi:hypothetical protein